MAPQRRSQRQQARLQAAATAATAVTTTKQAHRGSSSPDSQPVNDQTDAGGLPPAKVPRKQNPSPRGTTTAAVVAPMSQMEAERAARIAANQARLAELELPQLAAGLAAATQSRRKSAPQSQRGISCKRSRPVDALPQRQSARTRGQAPDPTMAGGIDHEARDGRVVLATFVPERYGTAHGTTCGGDSAAAAAAATRPPPGPLQFSSRNGDEATDAAFLQQLQRFAAAGAAADADSPAAAAASGGTAGGVLDAARLMQLQLRAVDVAKLTTQGVSCLAFHPSSTKPIIAAADKSGKVGLWDIDHTGADDSSTGDSSSSSGGYDGVLMFEPHSDYISSLKWLGPSGAGLLTGSYDGLVRRLDVETGVWELVGGVPADPDDNNWSAGDATPDGSTIYLATSAGQFRLVDTRCDDVNTSPPVLIANRKVNTLQLHHDQVHLLSSASDGTLAVWDVRQLAQTTSSSRVKTAKPVASGQHFKSSQGAYWEPNGGQRVLSISFDDTLRIWDLQGTKFTQKVSIRHNNNTGRWVMPFRPAWSPSGDAVCVGDLKRGVSVYTDTGAALGVLSGEALTAIPSRLAMHTQGLLAAATSSGRVHIFR